MPLDVPVNPYDSDTPGNAGAGDAPTWLDALARVGYAARGVVYLLIGGLALMAAFSGGGSTGGSKNALASLSDGPLERTVLGLVALGLFAYAAWRAVQAALDPDDHGTDAKGLAVRAGLGVSAVTHTLLAIWALTTAVSGGGSSGGGGGKEGMSAWVLGLPGGRLILGLIALCILGAAVSFAVKAFKEKWEDRFRLSAEKMKKIRPVCKAGLLAKAVVFVLIAGFVGYAAWTHNPDQAGGLGQALSTIRSQPFGSILLGLTALGLFAFGLYSCFEALYRKIDAPASLK